jgi:two-component system phosphate regulon sensor histidine kinase PhoR
MSFRLSGTPAQCLVIIISGAVLVYLLTWSVLAASTSGVIGFAALALLYDSLTAEKEEPVEVGRTATESDEAASHAIIDTVIDALPEPVLIVQGGRISHANRAAMQVLGDHVRGEDVRLAIRHPAVTRHLFGNGAGSEPVRMELVGIGAPDRSWELRITPLSDNAQLVLLTDQSARQAAERMRVDFVANASHELRTPLAGIVGFIETLKDREAGSDTATRERFLSIMEGEARRMQRLVEDLMSLSRIEADKFRLPEQSVDLCDLVEETVLIFRSSGNNRAADIALDLDLSVPQVRGDAAQLGQLVHNLVSNAMKYGRAGTPVNVAVQHGESGSLMLRVADEGEGIASEHLPRLTERFYRVDSSRSRAMGGTGLGLAIVKHIVERHRGRFQIESVAGQGTTVSVILPSA